MTNEVYAGSSTDAYTPTHLITGEKKVVTASVALKSGETIQRYALLGIDGSGKALLSLSAAGDGSEVPAYIAAYEEDATGGEKIIQVYAEGCFNPDLIVFGTGHTAASVEETLRARGIYLKAPK